MNTENRQDSITIKAHAKINLSLEVIGRREDGYHNIRSLMQGIGLYDVIKITKCPRNGTKYNLPHCTIDDVVVYLCTDAKTIPVDMTNLAFKGIKAVLDHYSFCPEDFGNLIIDIEKRLPVAAGIAGGSGNAAACMLGLNAILGHPFSLRELMTMGTAVGADVPFSLMMNAALNAPVISGLKGIEEASPAAWVSGIGEVVDPTEGETRYVIMANPGISVSTAAAYKAIDALQAEAGITDDTDGPPLFINDLEGYTLNEYPEAAYLKSVMQKELDADIVLMSGSGPTMAAYYEDRDKASAGFARMKELSAAREGWRAWLTETGKNLNCLLN